MALLLFTAVKELLGLFLGLFQEKLFYICRFDMSVGGGQFGSFLCHHVDHFSKNNTFIMVGNPTVTNKSLLKW